MVRTLSSGIAGKSRLQRIARWYAVIPLLFMLNAGIGIAHHQLWFDELQNWSLVQDSPTIPDLFHNLGHEGHPALWYLILWVAQRFSTGADTIKFCNWLFAVGYIGLIGYCAPFRKLDRILLMAGQLFLFQYVVFSRNYGIGGFFALLYAHVETTYPHRKYSLYLILGLLANCNAFTLMLSSALVAGRMFQGPTVRSAVRRVREEGPPLALYVVLAALSTWTIYPASDMKFAAIGDYWPTYYDLKSAWSVLQLFFGMFDGYFDLGQHSFVLYSAMMAYKIVRAAILSLAPFVVLFGRRDLLATFSLCLLLFFTFCFAVFQHPDFRHTGTLWLAFVVCYWIKYHRDRKPSYLATLFFILGVIWGVQNVGQIYTARYSNASLIASWVREHDLQKAFWITSLDWEGVTLSAYLGIPTYSPECGCIHKHIVWNTGRREIPPSEIGRDLLPVLDRQPDHVAYFILSNIQNSDQPDRERLATESLDQAGIHYDVLQKFLDSRDNASNAAIYRLTGPGS